MVLYSINFLINEIIQNISSLKIEIHCVIVIETQTFDDTSNFSTKNWVIFLNHNRQMYLKHSIIYRIERVKGFEIFHYSTHMASANIKLNIDNKTKTCPVEYLLNFVYKHKKRHNQEVFTIVSNYTTNLF